MRSHSRLQEALHRLDQRLIALEIKGQDRVDSLGEDTPPLVPTCVEGSNTIGQQSESKADGAADKAANMKKSSKDAYISKYDYDDDETPDLQSLLLNVR